MQILIRRNGTLMDISPDGQSPLPEPIALLITPKLTYAHKTLLQGHQRFGPDGQSHAISVENRRMYKMEYGRLVTGFGFLNLVCEILQAHGHTVGYVDLSPPRERPDCYEPDYANVQRYCEFRPAQAECVDIIARNQLGIINGATGFGKTHLFEPLVHLYPKAKFDIVVKQKDVAKSIVGRLTKTIPNVGLIGGGGDWKGDRVTVYTAGSLHHTDGDCDILLCDEVHALMTEKTAPLLASKYRYSRNFGFTATPTGRLDGADAQLEMFFGREIFRLPYQQAVELGLVVPITVRWLPIDIPNNPAAGRDGVPKQRWGIWRNDARNQLIADDIHAHYGDPAIQVLVMVATVEHAVHLWQYMKEFSLCYGEQERKELDNYKRTGLLPAGYMEMTSDRREQLRNDFASGKVRKVIATDIWNTGVDFTNLQVLYRADARESRILDTQVPGRVARIADGKERGLVVDCYDVFDKTFRGKSDRRRRNYKRHGWEQETVGVPGVR